MTTCAFCNSQLIKSIVSNNSCVTAKPKIHEYHILSTKEILCITENFTFYIFKNCIKFWSKDEKQYINFDIRNFKPKPRHLDLTSEQLQEEFNKLIIFS